MPDIQRETVTDFHAGNDSVGTVKQRLPEHPVYKEARIKASADNEGTIFVGTANVSIDSYPLAAGEEITILVDQLATIWVLGSQSNQFYKWIAA